jgi:hypothetical protein
VIMTQNNPSRWVIQRDRAVGAHVLIAIHYGIQVPGPLRATEFPPSRE